MRKFSDLQLTFDLPELDEVEGDAAERAISYQEAREISEAARLALMGQPQGAARTWFEDYLGLIEKGWPWRVACYMAWASSPKGTRWPKTLKDLATEVLGLTGPRVIHAWREKYPAIDTVVQMLQAAPLWEHRRDVIEALVNSAMTEDYKNFNDRKLFLEMTGDYVPRSQLDLGRKVTGDMDDLSDEELRGMIGKTTKDQGPTTDDLTPQPPSRASEARLKGQGEQTEGEA